MPSCCLIRPAGTSPTSSTSPATSPCCRCRQNHPNSTRSKTSGNSCATTGSPIVSSGPTTTSLSTVATPGTNSSISLGHHVDRPARLGPRVLISETWYNLLFNDNPDFVIRGRGRTEERECTGMVWLQIRCKCSRTLSGGGQNGCREGRGGP